MDGIMKKMLITGAGGQLSTEALTFFSQQTPPAHSDTYDCVAISIDELDITDKTSVEAAFKTYQPDILLNCAAITDVDGSEAALYEEAYRVNRDGARILAEACARSGSVLVHISTDYVFDGSKDTDYNEDDKPNPQGVYGQSKLEGETAIQESGCKFFTLRTAWLYSHYGNNFLKTMLRLGKERGEVSVVTDQRGNPTTTLELCRIIDTLLKTDKYGLYHAVCSGVCTWNEFAKNIFTTYGLDVKVHDVTTEQFVRPAPRPANSGLSTKKLQQATGYKPKNWHHCLREYHSLDKGVTRQRGI
jgi:dTDP-4-dehydrorhamnose reductase